MKCRVTLPTIVAISVVVVLVLGVVGGWTASSERMCVSCHSDFAKARAKTAHASTRCLACHAPGVSGRTGMAGQVLGRMIPGTLLGRSLQGPAAEIPRKNCIACHSMLNRSVSSGSSGLRIRHMTCALDASCDTCHSTTAHGALIRWQRAPVMENCTACHAVQKAPLRCDVCHVGKSTQQRLTTGPWQVTHGANWKRTHGMGRLDSCVSCHPADYCAHCHKVAVPHAANFGSQHGKAAIIDRSSCLLCHKTQVFCNACHGVEMPHPPGFFKSHSAVAKKVDGSVCHRCHTQETCDNCHVAHVHPGFNGVHKPSVIATSSGRP